MSLLTVPRSVRRSSIQAQGRHHTRLSYDPTLKKPPAIIIPEEIGSDEPVIRRVKIASNVATNNTRKLETLAPETATYNLALALALVVAVLAVETPDEDEKLMLRDFSRRAWKENCFTPDLALGQVIAICRINDQTRIDAIVTEALAICAKFQPCDHWDTAVNIIRDNDDIHATDVLGII